MENGKTASCIIKKTTTYQHMKQNMKLHGNFKNSKREQITQTTNLETKASSKWSRDIDTVIGMESGHPCITERVVQGDFIRGRNF